MTVTLSTQYQSGDRIHSGRRPCLIDEVGRFLFLFLAQGFPTYIFVAKSVALSHRFGLLPGRLMAFEEILIKLLEGDAMADQSLPTLGLVSLLGIVNCRELSPFTVIILNDPAHRNLWMAGFQEHRKPSNNLWQSINTRLTLLADSCSC